MKKTTVLFLCVTMLCTLLGAFFTSCGIVTKIPSSIEVVDSKTTYYLNDVVDYDSIKAKIVYDDETTKEGTVKSLKMTVTEKADLSQVGETSYTVSYGDLTYTVTITVLDKSAVVTALELVDLQDKYVVGDVIDYDALIVKVTYADGNVVNDTVKNLGVEVTQRADLSKEDATSYTLSLKGVEKTVNLEVLCPYFMGFDLPSFYQNYLSKSKDRKENEVETQGDFRITGEVYEVGNVNKFLFPLTIIAEGIDSEDVRTITSPVVSVKVYEKTTLDGTYKALTAADTESVVIIDGNSYKFTDAAAGKYYKLEITPDEEVYEVDANSDGVDEDKTVSLECYIVGGGYNVYDQIGLSVMNDLSSKHWTEIWKCDIDDNYKLTARQDSLKLEADDKPLCEYVGNIDWVVLHTSFAIDADKLPSYYFWTEQTEGYSTAKGNLPGIDGVDELLIGSLRDGVGNGNYFTVTNIRADDDRYSSQLGYSLNGQKAFFSTYKVSVSGNYNGITVPSEKSKGGRSLYSVIDYGAKTDISGGTAPTPHWQIFQLFQSEIAENYASLTLKNLSMTGNSGQITEADFVPGSMMMTNCFGDDVSLINVVANSFYTNVVCDGFSTSNMTNGVKVDSTKLYDAFSNMFYSWRANIKVTNSDLVGSGGPLFILCDGSNYGDDPAKCVLTVDQKSKLQAYATGGEAWYKLNGVDNIVRMIQGQLDPAFNQLHKTVLFNKNTDNTYSASTSSAVGSYVNVIAAMICEPGDIFNGKSDDMLKVRGIYQTVDENGKVIEKFDMRNNYVQAISATANNNAKKFAPIFQHGDNYAFTQDLKSLQTLDFTNYPNVTINNFTDTDGDKWATDTHDKIGVYMSAGLLSAATSSNAPYFGVILGSAQYK